MDIWFSWNIAHTSFQSFPGSNLTICMYDLKKVSVDPDYNAKKAQPENVK